MTELEQYRELYNKFVSLLAELHNCNVRFSKQPSNETGFFLRKILRKMRDAEKELWSSAVRASKEVKANKRAKLLQKQKDAEYRKLNPPKRGRPKKER